jgi:hypothetical protein
MLDGKLILNVALNAMTVESRKKYQVISQTPNQ